MDIPNTLILHQFIGRKKELFKLANAIDSSNHTVISAPRRFGKTSTVEELLTNLKKSRPKEFLIVELDIFAATNVKELCFTYIKKIYQSLGFAGEIVRQIKSGLSIPFKLIKSLNAKADGLEIGLDLLNSKKSDAMLIAETFNFAEKVANLLRKKMIVFFDEFGSAGEKYGEGFLEIIRSHMQKHKSVVYLLAGSQTHIMNKIFLNRDNAFYHFASMMEIGMLNDDEVKSFLTENTFGGKVIEYEGVRSLMVKIQGHPFYLTRVVNKASLNCDFEKRKLITENDIESAINELIVETRTLYQDVWNKINMKKYKGSIFKSFCALDSFDENVTPSYRSQLIRELKSESFISESGQPTDPLLCLWLQSQ
jgi:AAA+ ATPase superfamily predicted ATPase